MRELLPSKVWLLPRRIKNSSIFFNKTSNHRSEPNRTTLGIKNNNKFKEVILRRLWRICKKLKNKWQLFMLGHPWIHCRKSKFIENRMLILKMCILLRVIFLELSRISIRQEDYFWWKDRSNTKIVRLNFTKFFRRILKSRKKLKFKEHWRLNNE